MALVSFDNNLQHMETHPRTIEPHQTQIRGASARPDEDRAQASRAADMTASTFCEAPSANASATQSSGQSARSTVGLGDPCDLDDTTTQRYQEQVETADEAEVVVSENAPNIHSSDHISNGSGEDMMQCLKSGCSLISPSTGWPFWRFVDGSTNPTRPTQSCYMCRYRSLLEKDAGHRTEPVEAAAMYDCVKRIRYLIERSKRESVQIPELRQIFEEIVNSPQVARTRQRLESKYGPDMFRLERINELLDIQRRDVEAREAAAPTAPNERTSENFIRSPRDRRRRRRQRQNSATRQPTRRTHGDPRQQPQIANQDRGSAPRLAHNTANSGVRQDSLLHVSQRPGAQEAQINDEAQRRCQEAKQGVAAALGPFPEGIRAEMLSSSLVQEIQQRVMNSQDLISNELQAKSRQVELSSQRRHLDLQVQENTRQSKDVLKRLRRNRREARRRFDLPHL